MTCFLRTTEDGDYNYEDDEFEDYDDDFEEDEEEEESSEGDEGGSDVKLDSGTKLIFPTNSKPDRIIPTQLNDLLNKILFYIRYIL